MYVVMGQLQPAGASCEPVGQKGIPRPARAGPGGESPCPQALARTADAQNKHLLFPSLSGRKFPQTFFLLLLSETKYGAVNMRRMQVTAMGVLDTKELASSPVMGLGTRGVWEDKLSVREQLCTIFQKGKTLNKSSNSLLSLPALKNIYSTQALVHGAWIY